MAGVPLDITLSRIGTVSGVVTDPGGNPVVGVDIRAIEFVPTVGWVQDAPFGTTGAGGSYEITVQPGRWAICTDPFSGLLPACDPDGWNSVLTPEEDGILIAPGEMVTGIDLQLQPDDRAIINVTLLDAGGAPATGFARTLIACVSPAVPVVSAAPCSDGSPLLSFEPTPPDPFNIFSTRLPAGTFNVAGGVAADSSSLTFSSFIPLTVTDGDEFNCTFTMNGPATCEVAEIRFTGADDNRWGNPLNWNTGTVPVDEDEVVIPAGVGPVVVDDNRIVGAIRLEGEIVLSGGGILRSPAAAAVALTSTIESGGVLDNQSSGLLAIRVDELVVDGELLNGAESQASSRARIRRPCRAPAASRTRVSSASSTRRRSRSTRPSSTPVGPAAPSTWCGERSTLERPAGRARPTSAIRRHHRAQRSVDPPRTDGGDDG